MTWRSDLISRGSYTGKSEVCIATFGNILFCLVQNFFRPVTRFAFSLRSLMHETMACYSFRCAFRVFLR